ncbi:MAG: zinc ribbon domain-containing protein [Oscillospiraceae bacterium]|nr:zinc ribbon domain-containing protein [Oscillospiraceae bacterium]
MAIFDKLNEMAKNIGDKTSDVIEITKLSGKVSSERSAAAEELKKIGEHYYQLFASGGEVAPEVLELCRSAKAHFDAANEAQTEIEKIKAGEETPAAEAAPAAPAALKCPSCGAANAAGTKFCQNCGMKLDAN